MFSLAGGAALAGVGMDGLPAMAASVRCASPRLKFGSLSWVLETIRAEGLAKKVGLTIDIIEVATNQAGPVALLSGEADVIVSDWPWALRQRALGEKLKFAPYSSALGAVMVPNGSKIARLADLEGKKLGVAGGAHRQELAAAQGLFAQHDGQGYRNIAEPVFGAAPLLTEEMRAGRVDALFNFWTYAARLSGAGFRKLIGMDEVLKALGIDPVPSLVGFIWREKTEAKKGPAIAAFLDAVAKANAILAQSDSAWERMRGLVRPARTMRSSSRSRRSIAQGIPPQWTAADTRSAEKLTQVLKDAGSGEFIGEGTRFDPKLFHAAGS